MTNEELLTEVRSRLRSRRVSIQNELRLIGESMACDVFEVIRDGESQSVQFANGYLVGISDIQLQIPVAEAVSGDFDDDDDIGGTDGDEDDDFDVSETDLIGGEG